jgi:hypothetical protein
MLVRDATARQKLRDAWQGLSNVQPRSDVDANVAAVPYASSAVAGASKIARDGLASVDQLEREAAALNAYGLSLGRFLGAQRTGDKSAMSRQAGLMVQFIDKAIKAAHEAARSRSIADRRILSELERRQNSAKQNAGGWSTEVPKLGRISASDLPPEAREELKSSSLSLPLQELNALKPAEIDAGIAALRARVNAQSASAGEPQPPDLLNLEQQRRRARELASTHH